MADRQLVAFRTEVASSGDGQLSASLTNPMRVLLRVTSGPWGWLAVLSLLSAVGLLLLSIAYTGARASESWAQPLFWIGLMTMFVPNAARLISSEAERRERIALVVVLGLGLYLVKVLHHPIAPMFHDEFISWRSANDIVQSQKLFSENPALPVSPFYPGLQNVTVALVSLGGLDIFDAGMVVIGVARIVLVLGLFLFYEQVSGSDRVAATATVLYMASPNFVFWSSQFGYESLGISLAALVLFAASYRARSQVGSHIGFTLVVLLGLGALTITHHLTSFALIIFLFIWAMVAPLRSVVGVFVRSSVSTQVFNDPIRSWLQRLESDWKPPGTNSNSWTLQGSGWTAILILVACFTWLSYIAILTVDYAGPYIVEISRVLGDIWAGDFIMRQLFVGGSGQLLPLWEQLVGYGSAILILLGLPFGIIVIWQQYRTNAAALALGLGALAYVASLPAHFIPEVGVELAQRANPFVFVAVAFVLAAGVVGYLQHQLSGWKGLAVSVGLISVIFVGGVILGFFPTERLPGPYQVVAQGRSIEREGEEAAKWAAAFLGPGNRIATDRINRLLMASYGQQHTVTNAELWMLPIFFSSELGAEERAIIRAGGIKYLVVDRRLSSGLPMLGFYFEEGEPHAHEYTAPFDLAALNKFDDIEQMNRIFDSGDIVVFDVGELWDAPSRRTHTQ